MGWRLLLLPAHQGSLEPGQFSANMIGTSGFLVSHSTKITSTQ